MAYLLTTGVVAFQLAILVTIVAAARAGRVAFLLATFGWIAFTLLGSIFTAGLLLLQLFTIGLAFAIGRSMVTKAQAIQPNLGSPQSSDAPKRASNGLNSLGGFALLVVAGLVTGKMFGRASVESDVQSIRARAAQDSAALPGKVSTETVTTPAQTRPQGVATTKASNQPKSENCWNEYLHFLNTTSDQISLVDYAALNVKAKERLARCEGN
ncbi:hypothetical protein [Casimicrobium huifangae]|uniref:hypothetical protein n=1 Tax=Casimicrobium huifangae TaxID=2591109 RepID=UPI0012EB6FDB|nr:hypothetical protein [Casimicrobium huifangae]